MSHRVSIRRLWLSAPATALLAVMGCADGCDCGAQAPPSHTGDVRENQPAPGNTAPANTPQERETAKPAPDKQGADSAQLNLKNIPKKVAKVGKSTITDDMLSERVKKRVPDFDELSEEKKDSVVRTIAENLVAEQMLVNKMESLDLEMDDQQVQKKLDEALSSFGSNPEEIEKSLGPDSALRFMLEESVRLNHMFDRIYEEEVLKDVSVSETEVVDYYNQNIDRYKLPERVRVRMIVLKYGDESEKAAKVAESETIIAQLRSGADFAQMAIEKSQDEGSRAMGGFAGMSRIENGEEANGDPYHDWVIESKDGEISGPIHYAEHKTILILKNDGGKPARTIPLDEVRDDILRTLKGAKASVSGEQFSQDLFNEMNKETVNHLQ